VITRDGRGDVESAVMIGGGIKVKKKKKFKFIVRDRLMAARVHQSRWSYQRLVNDQIC